MFIIDFILNIDEHLGQFLTDYGSWVYAILFLIIFVETGLVIMPFLPGDSLLFAAGMLAAQYPENLNVWIIIISLILAGFLGDSCNYLIGKFFGKKAMGWTLFGRKLVKQEYIDKTNDFFNKYGPTTIIIARFVPFVRTFAPFVAGVGSMKYNTFVTYNFIGAVLWVVGLTLAGYFLGNIPFVKDNFEKVVLLIIFISVIPVFTSFYKNWKKSRKEKLLSNR